MCLIYRTQSKHLFVLEDISFFQRMCLIYRRQSKNKKSLRLKSYLHWRHFLQRCAMENLGAHYKVDGVGWNWSSQYHSRRRKGPFLNCLLYIIQYIFSDYTVYDEQNIIHTMGHHSLYY
jgi:hypothetical protein